MKLSSLKFDKISSLSLIELKILASISAFQLSPILLEASILNILLDCSKSTIPPIKIEVSFVSLKAILLPINKSFFNLISAIMDQLRWEISQKEKQLLSK